MVDPGCRRGPDFHRSGGAPGVNVRRTESLARQEAKQRPSILAGPAALAADCSADALRASSSTGGAWAYHPLFGHVTLPNPATAGPSSACRSGPSIPCLCTVQDPASSTPPIAPSRAPMSISPFTNSGFPRSTPSSVCAMARKMISRGWGDAVVETALDLEAVPDADGSRGCCPRQPERDVGGRHDGGQGGRHASRSGNIARQATCVSQS